MQKRAFGDNVMIYILAVVILGAIALIGWKMVSSTSSRFCKTELADLQIELEDVSQMRTGNVEERSIPIPCRGNKLVIMDSASAPDISLFGNYPLIQDAIRSKTGVNVFVIQDRKVLESFSVPHLMVDGSHMLCAASSGKISLSMESVGVGTRMRLLEPQQDCSAELGS